MWYKCWILNFIITLIKKTFFYWQSRNQLIVYECLRDLVVRWLDLFGIQESLLLSISMYIQILYVKKRPIRIIGFSYKPKASEASSKKKKKNLANNGLQV